jgi:heat-inducible transcriptional repressor
MTNGSDRTRISQREHEVLNAVVTQYIQTGEPVGSRSVAKTNIESLSPATIRSIMADLEEAGFITHPHTSAGRIPTDAGYRHYVDTMDAPPRLSDDEMDVLASGFHAAGGLSSLLERCCKLLSAASHQVGVGTAPDLHATMFRHVELVRVNEHRLLVVFLTAAGQVFQRVIEEQAVEAQAALDRHARLLNEELHGRTLPEVRDHLAELMRHERLAYDGLARRALELGAHFFADQVGSGDQLYVEGSPAVLGAGAAGVDFDSMKTLVATLENRQRVLRLLNRCLAREGVTTAIGSESATPELAGCSLVATSYGTPEAGVGTLGIIGPTRMNYDRAMALVEYVAELLSSALASTRT